MDVMYPNTSFEAVYDKDSNTDFIIDYSGNVSNPNDVKTQLSAFDTELTEYLNNVETVINDEKAYGISKKSYLINGECPAMKPANDIIEDVIELRKDWKDIKKKIKKGTLTKREELLKKIYYDCRRSLPLVALFEYTAEEKKYDEKSKEVWKLIEDTRKRKN